MTLYYETPCDHGDVAPHGIGINARITGRIDCPGGERVPVSIDYEAAEQAFAEWADHTTPEKAVVRIVDAALNLGDPDE